MPNEEPIDAGSSPHPIVSVGRTLGLLQFLARHEHVRLVDVREHLGIASSTAHRLMATLVHHEFAVEVPDGPGYRAGPALFALSGAASASIAVKEAARSVLQWLAHESGETAHLGVLWDAEVSYVDVIESSVALRVTGRVGRTSPAQTTSLGKSMLATMPDDDVRKLFAGRVFEQSTKQSITDIDSLLAELRRTRRRGWARNRSEMAAGVWSVGVAVRRDERGVLAALSIATPQARSSSRLERVHAELLTTAAQRLRDRL